MTYQNVAKTYLKTNIETADTIKLVIMCYDAAIADLEIARKLHESGVVEATYDKIRHAQDIITELLVGLDYERGGEISINLSRIYNFILRQLIGINIRQDTAMYGHIIRMLSELREAWVQIRQNAPASSTSPPQPSGRSWEVSA